MHWREKKRNKILFLYIMFGRVHVYNVQVYHMIRRKKLGTYANRWMDLYVYHYTQSADELTNDGKSKKKKE